MKFEDEDDGSESDSSFRMFGVGIKDGEVIDEDSGFEGPDIEEEDVTEDGKTMKKKYVSKTKKNMWNIK